jgi:HK97 gp10 family phage protein
MSETVSVEIKGLDVLQRRLEALPKKVGARVLRKGLKSAAALVVDAIVALAPKRTGFLAEHFATKTRIQKEDIAGFIQVGPSDDDYPDREGHYRIKFNRAGKAKLTGRIGVDDVARYHEFGTVHEPAKPFVTAGFESAKDAAMNEITSSIQEALDEIK